MFSFSCIRIRIVLSCSVSQFMAAKLLLYAETERYISRASRRCIGLWGFPNIQIYLGIVLPRKRFVSLRPQLHNNIYCKGYASSDGTLCAKPAIHLSSN